MGNVVPAFVAYLLSLLLLPLAVLSQTRSPIQLPQSVQADSLQRVRAQHEGRLQANNAALQQRFRALFATALTATVGGQTAPATPPPDNPLARYQVEVLRTMDPLTQTVPLERVEQARREVQLRIRQNDFASTLPNPITWSERGPNNVGGRTRVLMFDPNDPTKKKVWAGGVAGGLWYTNDITNPNQSWQKASDLWENIAVTSMAYDPSQPNIMYVGTGEAYYNMDGVQGGGIWKTTDGGQTWSRLTATVPINNGDLATIAGAFQAIYRLVVAPGGTVYAATWGGLVKSTDGGTSWTFDLVPARSIGTTTGSVYNITDIDLATDGALFAVAQGSLVYRRSSGSSSWEVKQANPLGYRAEIALAPSTSGGGQVIYLVAASASVMLRSTDGGTSWTNLPLPSSVTAPLGEQSWYNLVLTVHPTNPNQVYLGTNRPFRSLDGGNSWAYQSGYWEGTHPDQHTFVFRPDAPNEMLLGNDGGVFYSSDFGNATVPKPTYSARNRDYNVTQFYSVAIKNSANDGYLLGGTQDNGSINVFSSATGPVSGNTIQGGDGMLSFIDQDDPNIQIASYQYNSYNLFNSNGVYRAGLCNGAGQFINPADYDSRTNTLYAFNQSMNNGTQLYKVSNVGTTNTLTTLFAPNNVTYLIRAGRQPNTVYLGGYGAVYKVTNTDQLTATTTSITSNIPGYFTGYVSCIELGATDDEMLVTISSYGTRSIWLTRNGGQTWESKDEAGYGLPDIPVRYALFNPRDRRQVMLATELGIWFTNNIYAPNPGWSSANTGLANTRCDMLRYRTADGAVAVGTHGRGLFMTDFFTQPIPDEIVVAPVTGPLCAGSTISLTFTATGTYQTTNTFTAYLTDASGSFSVAQPLGTVNPFAGNSLPLSATLTGGVYRLLVRSGNPVISSAASQTFIIGERPTFSSLLPSLPDRTTSRIDLRVGSTQNATAYYMLAPRQYYAYAQQVRDGLAYNGRVALRSGSLPLLANQPVSIAIDGLMPGVGYRVNVVLEDPISGCLSNVVPLDTIMAGMAALYCTPQSVSNCVGGDVIADFVLQGTALNRINSGCSYNGYDQLIANGYAVRATADYGFIFRTYYNNGGSYFPQHIAIWLDANRDGVYSPSERLYKSTGAITSNGWTGTLTIPPIQSGLYRLRVRCRWYSEVNDPCEQYTYGETEDYILDVAGLETLADVSLRMSVDNRVAAVNQPVTYQLAVRNDGQQTARNVLIGSRLPANSQLTEATNWTTVNGQLQQLIPALAMGEETSLTFAVMPTQPGTYQTAAQVVQVSPADPDSRPGSGTGDGEDDMATVDMRTATASSDYFASPNPGQFPLPALRSSQPAPDPSGADLSLQLVLSSRNTTTGSTVTLYPTVFNAGGRSVNNVKVQFWLQAPLTGPTGPASYSLLVASLPVNASVTQPITLTVGAGNGGYLTVRGAIIAASEPDPDSDRVTFGKGQDHEAFVDLRVWGSGGGGRQAAHAGPQVVVLVSPAQPTAATEVSRTYQADIRIGEDGGDESANEQLTIRLQNSRGRVVKTWRMPRHERVQFLFTPQAYGPGAYRLVVQHEGRTYRSAPFEAVKTHRPLARK
ncbi:hypothetical protein J2I47_08395 [Fibrella sp. HMF5335]|uniref:DUF11 domain-containing protein n=1 Tax=Fibrella rubiginis TaxID=2817060 RepID=A0A939GCR8_9BACT|nr:GEVED domain-containing protein [Fibrella rubiginis]MBO0936559.1 hypothetical protein [Fibrella rubiginis]